MPEGGAVIDESDKPLGVVHTTKKGDSLRSIAKAYLDFADVYFIEDFEKEIAKANPHIRFSYRVDAGSTVVIPRLIDAPHKSADEERLGWPADKALRGVFLHSDSRDRFFYALERMPGVGMNAIVLDAKDYDGWFTYPSKVAVARETEATKPAMIRDFARVVRFAHKKGIRVIARICCFHDPHTAERAKRLSIKGKNGAAYPIGWLDPMNPEVHAYILDVVKEVLETGVDEIQLDYVRFPVQRGLNNADLPPAGQQRRVAIRDFVRKVHTVTKARNVPLSLDVFGVVAFGRDEDINNLGQDLGMLATECEVLSPMVYPSHYAKGFRGWDEPGDHPEIVGLGTRASVEQIRAAGVKEGALIRPWAQAMPYKSPSFGPKYVADEIRTAEAAGAVGWLLWNPAEGYDTSYRAAALLRGRTEATAKR
jgi:hypothetical protein